jgi:two-component system sensor histidine kinase/response regulator
VQTIRSTSHQMLEMVNELLDIATIESGELKLRREPTALGELVEKAVHLMAMEAARKTTKLSLLPLPTLPALRLDSGKVRQVVDNLLTNGGEILPSRLHDHDRRSPCPKRVCQPAVYATRVPGIPEGEREKLFKDFGRFSVKPTGGETSTGLGLAICSNIVDAHNGTIAAENLPQGGCKFIVTLPIET